MMMKAMKIGRSDSTDSFTPRRFISTINATTMMHNQNLKGSHDTGRKLKIASAPLAIEIAMVST